MTKQKLRLRRETPRHLDALTLGRLVRAGAYGSVSTISEEPPTQPTDVCQSHNQGCRTSATCP